MAEDEAQAKGGSRMGKPERGTQRQQLQAPHETVIRFRTDLQDRGPMAVRFMGTVALSLIVAMPDEWRDRLFEYVQHEKWVNQRDVTPSSYPSAAP